MKRRRAPPNPAHMAGNSQPQPFPAKQKKIFSCYLPSSFNPLIHNNPSQVKLPLMETQKIIQPTLSQPFFTAYGPKLKVTLDCPPGFGRTKQSFKDDSNINNILSRFAKTGVLDFANKHQAQYGDATGADFQNAMNIVANANSMFAELPAAVRARFKHDPAEFLDFVQDERNTEEAIAMGLGTARVAPVQPPGAPLSPSHREDGSATHEPLRAPDGTFREHTRKEKRDEARVQKASDDAA